MSGLIPKPKSVNIQQPKARRMPTISDPNQVRAAQRLRERTRRRTGLLSTILSGQDSNTVG